MPMMPTLRRRDNKKAPVGLFCLAGVAGFEPTHGEVKVRWFFPPCYRTAGALRLKFRSAATRLHCGKAADFAPARTVRTRHNQPKKKSPDGALLFGWGGWIRTNAWRSQSPLPYRLATPHRNARAGELQGRFAPPCRAADPTDLEPFAPRCPTTIPKCGDEPYDQEREIDEEREDIERDDRCDVGNDGTQEKGPQERDCRHREHRTAEPPSLVHLSAVPQRSGLARSDAIEERNRPREVREGDEPLLVGGLLRLRFYFDAM